MRPRTPEEYVDLVEQALFEIEELRASAEYDMEEMGEALGFVDELEAAVRALLESMRDGSYRFADEDLPFMRLIEPVHESLLPFKSLLKLINDTHRQGLDAGD
ncbi:MAG TPA: general secretion pathway protein GspF [Chromatiales bacterium]|nr:general secretion pathway protein GspF [Chromatiales bacterium]